MTIGLTGVVEDAIRDSFQIVFHNDKAIIAAITVPKFKLKCGAAYSHGIASSQ